jgi:hypothetical protein
MGTPYCTCAWVSPFSTFEPCNAVWTLSLEAISATKPNRLMLFGGIIAVYCENHMEHTDTLFGQNVEFYDNKARVTYSYHCSLKH